MSYQYVALPGEPGTLKRPSANQRVYVRYQCAPASAGRLKLEGQEWQRAWVLDLCLSGVGLLISRSVEVGLEVVIHLAAAAEKKILELPARVCHATLQPDGDWVVGCEFVSKLTDDLLDALLQ
ncbi:MAG TPA: PilZ domain-containing protein [Gemmataceae bacterium]|nr:PilZ domain-containing protein [Gemmataceae bacterium]